MSEASNHVALREPRLPRLSVDWQPWGHSWWSDLLELLRGPRGPRISFGGHYFRDTLVRHPIPKRALLASLLCHIAVWSFPVLPRPARRPPELRPQLVTPRVQLTWYLPPRNLPRLQPPGPAKKPAPSPQPLKEQPRLRLSQTILSAPRLPNHPRQTLIQPDAPQVAPKVLPPLPNIVRWVEPARPARPRAQFRMPPLPRARSRAAATRPPEELPVPAVPNRETRLAELNIAASPPILPKPRMPVAPGTVPRPGPRPVGGEAAPAPEISAGHGNGNSEVQRVIALSATPAELAPVIEVPPGNLQSRIVRAPELNPASAPAAGSSAAPTAALDTSIPGPPGISITGGDPKNTSPVAGPAGAAPARPLLLKPLPANAASRAMPGQPGAARPTRDLDRIKPGAPPEHLLGPKRVYSLQVDMPNLTSVTGSWVLRFAELDAEAEAGGNGGNWPDKEVLVAPVAVRKVDPKYPPALISAKVQGEVILYAIIRRDGSVDSIQLVKSVDPQLDQNAIEALARWKFRPAERRGEAVELEAVVHIPFRLY